jgi:diadenosine tetraphosphate (Ap4A) HIT family hydrolase
LAFQLDPRLEKDTFYIGDLPLSRVLLANVVNFPWIILVPKVPEVSELFELSSEQQNQYLNESNFLLQEMSALYKADKMNIANLGNMVPQLHIHIVARYQDDDAWPGPIWSFQNTENYSKAQAKIEIDKIANLIDDYLKGETNE